MEWTLRSSCPAVRGRISAQCRYFLFRHRRHFKYSRHFHRSVYRKLGSVLEWHKRPLYRHMGFHCKLTQQYSELADRCVRCIPWLVRYFMGRGLDSNQGYLYWYMGKYLFLFPINRRFLRKHLECDFFLLYGYCNCYS